MLVPVRSKRPIKFATRLAIMKKWGRLGTLGLTLTLVPLMIIAIAKIFVMFGDANYANVDIDELNEPYKLITGTVKSIEPAESFALGSKKPVIIQFEYYADGQTRSGVFRAAEIPGHVKVGGSVPVKFAHDRAELLGIEQYQWSLKYLYWICLPFFVVGFTIILSILGQMEGEHYVYKVGDVTSATVTAISTRNFFVMNPGLTYLHYRYAIGGKTFEEKATSHDTDYLADKKVGDKIKIFVGNKKNNESCLIAPVEVRRNNWKV